MQAGPIPDSRGGATTESALPVTGPRPPLSCSHSPGGARYPRIRQTAAGLCNRLVVAQPSRPPGFCSRGGEATRRACAMLRRDSRHSVC